MSDVYDPLDALFEEPEEKKPAQEAPAVEVKVEEPKAKEEEKQEAPADPDADVVVDANGVKMVPYAALKEARDRAKAAEARQAAPVAAPDKSDDADEADPFSLGPVPERGTPEWTEYMFTAQRVEAINDRLNRSEKDAIKEHGAEFAGTIRDWAMARFEKDPAFAQRVVLNSDPYAEAIAIYKREEQADKMSKLPPEVLEGLDEEEIAILKAHREAKTKVDADEQPREEGTGRFTAQPAAPRSRSPAPPGRTLARAAPASGKGGSGAGAQAVGPGQAFDDVFK